MNWPTVLITRAENESKELAKDVRKLGVHTLISPMLKIKFYKGITPSFLKTQGILFTSSNGVRALDLRLNPHNKVFSIPVFAVGDATAKAAKQIGFTCVTSAGGNLESLAECTSENLSPGYGELVHIAGHDLAGDLAGRLKEKGFCVRTEKIYRAESITEIDIQTLSALKQREVAFILFFSPRTTRIFVSLIKAIDYANSLVSIEAICLSNTVAEEAKALHWRKVSVSMEPTKDKLLHSLAQRIPLVRDYEGLKQENQ